MNENLQNLANFALYVGFVAGFIAGSLLTMAVMAICKLANKDNADGKEPNDKRTN